MRDHISGRNRPSRGVPALGTIPAWLIALSLNLPGAAQAQQTEQPAEAAKAESLSRIDAEYQRERARIDRERIERLTRLAESQKGGDSELTFLEVFRFAIAADRYRDAEPAAERVIRAGTSTREVEFLAHLVRILAKADRGDYDGSMRDLRAYLAADPPVGVKPQAQTRTNLAVGEAYFRRLVTAGRFDLAREVCDRVIDRAGDPAVRDHFSDYRRRLDFVGRPAPAIEGVDVDGAPVRLDDLKGKVVLVVFWATWCPPCVERLPVLNRALELHEKSGFAVLGVNLDGGPDRKRLVRKFVVEFGVPWPSVLSAGEEPDVAARYAVTEIPANVLIGRDGKVVTFDLGPANLLGAVSEALGRPARPR
jgi:thiol-disulfide isomerase/thioredoxin